MDSTEKKVSYNSINSYATLNTLTAGTKNVWFVCHGIGYLSKYFLRYFKDLNKTENYIIAPQAQSKYYLGSAYKHVGASWLTKENTEQEIENVVHYFDAVLKQENLSKNISFIVLGYSQGVSVAMRYVAKRRLKCDQLILLSGGIPNELKASDFEFLRGKTKVTLAYGDQDEYLTNKIMIDQKKRFYDLFDKDSKIICFKGKHEVKKELINKLV
ncbi:MAG: esterase [Flavobacteriaceae bacterium]|nr:esterase [Flavobacteriaceae bacterium]